MSTYEISKSSLLSLKAEILRKQEELSKVKAENDVKIRNIKKAAPLDLKNKGVESRQTQDSVEEENLITKSRECLEAKSKLYDKLSRNPSNLSQKEVEFNRRFLVRFDKKKPSTKIPKFDDIEDDYNYDEEDDTPHENYAPPKNKDEEWVEYVDCLGRTRTCLRKDLEYLRRRDKDLKVIVDSKEKNRRRSRSKTPEKPPDSVKPTEITENNEMLSNDMRREILRKQWEEEEENLRNKSDIHYQDILFNEARSHGVGYYSFSKDEDVRSKQQEALNKLREETKEKQKKAQELKNMREKQLRARIRAAKNRKRERMGLPPLEEGEDEPEEPPEEKEDKQVDDESEVKKNEEQRKKHIRPWDIGKEGVKQHYEHTQEEWVDKQRRERKSEFAPPSSYTRRRRRRSSSSSDSDTEYNKRRIRAESVSSNVSDSIDAGLRFLREQIEKKVNSDRVDMFQ